MKTQEGISTPDCDGQHRFFVVDVVGVEAEGRIYIPIVCTACGEFRHNEISVGRGQIRLLKEEQKHKE